MSNPRINHYMNWHMEKDVRSGESRLTVKNGSLWAISGDEEFELKIDEASKDYLQNFEGCCLVIKEILLAPERLNDFAKMGGEVTALRGEKWKLEKQLKRERYMIDTMCDAMRTITYTRKPDYDD